MITKLDSTLRYYMPLVLIHAESSCSESPNEPFILAKALSP